MPLYGMGLSELIECVIQSWKNVFFVSKKIPTRGPLVTPLVALFVPGVMGLHFKSIDAVTEKKTNWWIFPYYSNE